jgi:hypothetical protein
MLNCLRSSFHDSSAARIAQIAPRAAPGTSLARAEATRRSRARSRSCPPAALALMVRPGTSCSTATRRALRAGSQRRRAPPRASWCARPPRGRLLGAWWVLRVSRCLCRLCTHTGRMSHAPSSCRQRLLLPRAGIPAEACLRVIAWTWRESRPRLCSTAHHSAVQDPGLKLGSCAGLWVRAGLPAAAQRARLPARAPGAGRGRCAHGPRARTAQPGFGVREPDHSQICAPARISSDRGTCT